MWLETVCATASAAIVYHHVGYPIALRAFARRKKASPETPWVSDAELPNATLIIPAYNEAAYIADKIANCAALEYPSEKLAIRVICDGCDDDTEARARAALAQVGGVAQAWFTIESHTINRGKTAVLNAAIADEQDGRIVFLSDATARTSADAVRQLARHFANPRVGFATARYDVGDASARQRAYWTYQNAIKADEAMLGAPIGAHGAFYAFRRAAWRPMEPDTINDDVVIPMRIVGQGFTGVYDADVAILEAERDDTRSDLGRRSRLAAGAIQQVARLWRLADPRRPGLAFAFLSGKGLRAVMPFLMATALLANIALAGWSRVWLALLCLQAIAYALAVAGLLSSRAASLPGVSSLSYLVAGHFQGLIGATRHLIGADKGPWARQAQPTDLAEEQEYLRNGAARGKRALDVVIACLALGPFFALLPIIAAAIKLESPGPVFYRQLRVGLRTKHASRLFHLTKFRTMRIDAETATGAVWATERDPRITRVGMFLRKTRLDELPQCFDVLRGDMSIVGPRPERPQFFNKLESAIPFYAERTYGLKPGITGLAQVTLPYDSSVEDVRAKVLHDHAYALRLSAPGGWLPTDLSIILRTFLVMVLGKGR